VNFERGLQQDCSAGLVASLVLANQSASAPIILCGLVATIR